MKYYDNQSACKGDKFIIGTFGTCHVEEIDEYAHVATVRNTVSGEVFELDSLRYADLITHNSLTEKVLANQTWTLPDASCVVIDAAEAYARIAELEAALEESNGTLSNAEKMLFGIYREIELHGEWEKGVSDCIDELRATISNNQKL